MRGTWGSQPLRFGQGHPPEGCESGAGLHWINIETQILRIAALTQDDKYILVQSFWEKIEEYESLQHLRALHGADTADAAKAEDHAVPMVQIFGHGENPGPGLVHQRARRQRPRLPAGAREMSDSRNPINRRNLSGVWPSQPIESPRLPAQQRPR